MKFLTIAGTRPNLTKIDTELKQDIIWSGQHFDKNMKDLGLKVPTPKYIVDEHKSPGGMLDDLIRFIELADPEYVIVYGDTRTALLGAIAAKQCKKRLIHIEAGMRCGRMDMQEEQNRIMIDHVSDILFCPSIREAERLDREQITGTIIISGATQLDTFFQQFPVPPVKKYKDYMLLTLHRAETVDNAEALGEIMEALDGQGKIVWPIHPRTKKRLEEFKIKVPDNIELAEPMKYKKFVHLMGTVKKILTDSGGIQPEAHFMRKDCITLRSETEWAQTVEEGWNTLVGTDKDAIRRAIAQPINIGKARNFVYGKGDAKKRIREYLESL